MSVDTNNVNMPSNNPSYWDKKLWSKCDVLIVGAGFTGLQTAIKLLEKSPQLGVRVIDQLPFGALASTRNAGFACFGSPTEILSDYQLIGRDKVLELLRLRFAGVEELRWNVQTLEVTHDFCGGYELFRRGDETKFRDTENQIEWVNDLVEEAGLGKDCFSTMERANFNDGTLLNQCFFTAKEFHLDPGELHRAFEIKAQNKGIQLTRNCKVLSFSQWGKAWQVETSLGEISCQRVLMCNNAGASEFLPKNTLRAARGQILLTEPLKNLNWKGNFHVDEGYYYFRNLGDQLLIGGARNFDLQAEYTSETHTSELIQRHLEQFAERHLLEEKIEVAARWAGTMCFRGDGNKMPLVQAIHPNFYLAAGFGGMGVALSGPMSSKLVEMVLT